MSPSASAKPAPTRLVQDHIRVVQAIYAILVSLALRQLVDGIPRCVRWIRTGSGDL